MARTRFTHSADEHFEFLTDYLRHLVDMHGVEETPELWRMGRTHFDDIHAKAHNIGDDHE